MIPNRTTKTEKRPEAKTLTYHAYTVRDGKGEGQKVF